MRQDLKKYVSNLIEREENVLSFGCDFSRFLQGIGFCQDFGVILSQWKKEGRRILDP